MERVTTHRIPHGGRHLRQLWFAWNLTQSSMAANRINVSYISAVEHGQIRPSLGAHEIRARRLHVPECDCCALGGECGCRLCARHSPRPRGRR